MPKSEITNQHTPRQVTFSNPAEVAKTRLQLQGELAKDGGVKVYNSAVDALAKTWRNEGIRGLQRGLSPAVSLCYFIALNHLLNPFRSMFIK